MVYNNNELMTVTKVYNLNYIQEWFVDDFN